MKHKILALLVLCAALLVSLAGCGLFGSEDTTIIATGRVVFTETGAPIAGLGVSLDRGGRILRFVAATTQTAADGTFRLEYDPGEDDNSTHALLINSEPYDNRYTVQGASYIRGERRDLGTVEIAPNPLLP